MMIGERIKQTRLEIPMTQSELAKKAGIKQPTLSELERGSSGSSSHFSGIAATLNVNALWLQTGKRFPPAFGKNLLQRFKNRDQILDILSTYNIGFPMTNADNTTLKKKIGAGHAKGNRRCAFSPFR
jgi:transcriptional regulator with XRE-family HTH domain